MAIKSDVFGNYAWQINVSEEIENGVVCLCCGLKNLGFILAGKAAQYLRWRWGMVTGMGYAFKCFLDTLGVIEELKASVIAGLVGIGFLLM